MSVSNGVSRQVAVVVAAATLLVSAVGLRGVVRAYGIRLEKAAIYPADNRRLVALPTETANWARSASDQIVSKEIVEELGTENYLTRKYRRKSALGDLPTVEVELHAAYYTEEVDTVPHVPERCFVGGGMSKVSASRYIALPMDTSGWIAGAGLTAEAGAPREIVGDLGTLYTARTSNLYSDAPGMRVNLPREIGPENPIYVRVSEFETADGIGVMSGYFFIANGGTVPDAEEVRKLAFDATSEHAYYLKVQVNAPGALGLERYGEVVADLLDDLLPEIMRCVPDWADVVRGEHPATAENGGVG
ncbi:MAG: exosortase-associated EpsI family protein [Planctomycetota bacterium]